MKYASDEVKREWDDPRVPEDLRDVVTGLDAYMVAISAPEVLLTDVGRDEAFYQKNGLPYVPSLHFKFRAVDLRTKHWTDTQKDLAKKWLEKRCQPRERFELITRDHGTGPHYHIGLKIPVKGKP